MKKILLSLAVIASGFTATSQIIVAGLTPGNIAGNYDFTWADPGGGDWACPDFNVAGTYITGELEMAEDGTAGTNPQGHPVSQEGCSALINNTDGDPNNDMTGKIAVIYRNTCEFGLKAFNAQNAGAIGVIIVNRDPEAVGMGGGADGTSVTIPVVMISSTDGETLINEMANGAVTMYIGNKMGAYGDDVGSNTDFTLTSPFGVNSNLIGDMNFPLGIQIYNFGTNNQSEVYVTATLDGPSGNLYTDVVGPLVMNAGDTIAIFDGYTYSFTPMTQMSAPVNGDYTLTYSLSINGVTDVSDFDNEFVSWFSVSDNIISLARLDGTTGRPLSNSYPSNTEAAYESCMMYQHSNASALALRGFFFTPHADTSVTELAGAEIFAYARLWNDPWVDMNDAVFDTNNDPYQDFVDIRVGTYSPLTDDETDQPAYIQFTSPLQMVNDQRYLMCLRTEDPDISFGYDNDLDYSGNLNVNLQPVAPIMVVSSGSDTWYTGAWSGSNAPSLGLDVFDAATISIEEPTAIIEAIAYPNPAKDVVGISMNAEGAAVITVTDISGKTVISQSVTLMNGSTSLNIADLENGMYIFNVELENGQTALMNVVKK